MFCMNCGQQLPEGAKFCLNCGTPQGAVSPTSPVSVKQDAPLVSQDLNDVVKQSLVPAMCPNCSAHLNVDPSYRIARCGSCGTECLVQDAINTFNIKGNVHVGNANITINGVNTDSLLQRAKMLLADGDFEGATQKCDTILDSDPTNGRAYLYLLMARLYCRKEEDLAEVSSPFHKFKYYKKAMEFGDDSLKSELQKYSDIVSAEFAEKLENLCLGSEIYYGSYEGQKIRWRAINVKNGLACLITTDVICNMPFHESVEPVTWGKCSLREWLNSDFVDNYFTATERKRIEYTKVNPESNFWHNTSGGTYTDDRVFILSYGEAKRLLTNETRSASDWWWLRTPGQNYTMSTYTEYNGKLTSSGALVTSDGGVRPVMWINIE